MAILVKPPKWTGWAGPSAGIAVGIFLMSAPSLLQYTGTGQEIAHRIAGPLMIMLWIPSFWEATRSLIWWAATVAIFLLVASIIIRGPTDAQIAGVAGALSSLIVALVTHLGDVADRYAGGWIGLFHDKRINENGSA